MNLGTAIQPFRDNNTVGGFLREPVLTIVTDHLGPSILDFSLLFSALQPSFQS